jgi:hypothetical protein
MNHPSSGSKNKKRQETREQQVASIGFELFFDTEGKCGIFLRNIG